ncbi:hypothetical protein [Desulfosporosinus lacus]|uniref:Uncharacterized protein n=1 Tax=Desulfosporosinus lacus DSM 15449 TaxID=1121420 RepID=A0A1M6EER4_9FIRM|nr:hypothetical protein [Desulfosporosinus lacus]SHI83788.1 hypothetical protein SAMN02746098_04720 [Desulfosporosinus lacus DSM 15449]
MILMTVILLNIPFGYWRENVKKFSVQWFLSVHLPVPVIMFLRIQMGLGWELSTYLMLVGAYFTGQYLGAMWHRRWEKSIPVSSCLVHDIVRSRWIIIIFRRYL